MVATACAVAAHKLRKPVRLIMGLQDNMEMVGKRNPYLFNYSVNIFDLPSLFSCRSELIGNA